MIQRLDIQDIRKITRSIFETYNIDFRNYALAALKQRLENVISLHSFRDADELIREGDEIYILQGNKLCAVGVAQMNGEEMKKSTQGLAIKVRHKN